MTNVGHYLSVQTLTHNPQYRSTCDSCSWVGKWRDDVELAVDDHASHRNGNDSGGFYLVTNSSANKAAYDNKKAYGEELERYKARERSTTTLQDLIKECRGDTEQWFPQIKDDLAHMVLGLNGEAGEVAEALKKGQRGSLDYDEAVMKVTYESVDVLIYLCNIWSILGVDPITVYDEIKAKNEVRFGKQE